MKVDFLAKILFFMMLGQHASADVVCPKTEYDSGYQKKLPIVDVDELIKRNVPLFDGGQIKCGVGMNYKNLSTNERLRTETGVYKGIKYRIYYSDGSGTIQGDKKSTLDTIKDLHVTNWSTRCKKDGMDDTHWCAISKDSVSIGIWKNGSHFISVGNDHFPSSNITLRVDQNAPISATAESGYTDKQVEMLIAQLKSGKSVLSRYQEWPYETNKDKAIDLFGFSEAWEMLNVIYNAPNQ
ncbi:hypothetical protein [Pseudomonas fluorescens]|uniref:hypothetical protein n=1 Tax=Pseudomonas fluorescens TaxID=294 RepID=UPI000699D3AA|nr:hypothetical protein [Pseudomonas fluorescens]